MPTTLTLEQAKAYLKEQVDRGDVYQELWDMTKRSKTIDQLIIALQMPIFACDPDLMGVAQYLLNTIQLKRLYRTLDVTRTLSVQKLGLAKGKHYGKFFTPGFYHEALTIYDLTADVARVMDLPYRLGKVGQGIEHWVAYWDSSLGEMGTVMELSFHLYGDREAVKYLPL